MSLYMEGDVPTVVGGGNNGSMWGGDGIWAILLLALLGGGYGFGRGGFGGGNNEFVGYELGKVATQADIASGFNNSALLSNQNDAKLQMANGFAGVDNAVCTLGYNMQQGFNMVNQSISDCCCRTQASIADLKYANERQTCDIIQAINSGNQRIIDYMQSEKIDTLNRKLAIAEGQISQYAQTSAIVAALKPQPVPSYTVPNPNCCYNNFGCGGTTL